VRGEGEKVAPRWKRRRNFGATGVKSSSAPEGRPSPAKRREKWFLRGKKREAANDVPEDRRKCLCLCPTGSSHRRGESPFYHRAKRKMPLAEKGKEAVAILQKSDMPLVTQRNQGRKELPRKKRT